MTITLDSTAASPLMFLVEFEASETVSVFVSVEDDMPSNQDICKGLSGMPRSFSNASFCNRKKYAKIKFIQHSGLCAFTCKKQINLFVKHSSKIHIPFSMYI